jgi:Methyltransferase domain
MRREHPEGEDRTSTSLPAATGTLRQHDEWEYLEYSPRRLNRLGSALRAASYLEIGVAAGKTFDAVTIPERTGVDPHFLFDVDAATNDRTVLNPMTSDAFFAQLPVDRAFDVIYIDGLHTLEQTYRDFCNSLAHSHGRSVILIDDTKPSDVYSAIPDHAKAMRHRRAAGGDSESWHGDVFKVVFLIHDFHPSLNYQTIVGSGNDQTLVWRSNAGWRDPCFNSLEAISRLTYFDTVDQADVLRCCSEDDALSACLIELNSRS